MDRRVKIFCRCFASLIFLVFTFSSAHATSRIIGPQPYLGFGDSPFLGDPAYLFTRDDLGGALRLEDFEDGQFAAGWTYVENAQLCTSPYCFADSVDEDDGVIDGSGSEGTSFCFGSACRTSSVILTIEFDSTALQDYPTHVGVVWTDGNNFGGAYGDFDVTFEWFDPRGSIVESVTISSPDDGSYLGGTSEDFFIGAVNSEGLAKLRISGVGAISYMEVDHLQFGYRDVFALKWPVPSLQKFATTQDFGQYYSAIGATHLGLDLAAVKQTVIAAETGIAYPFPLPENKKNNCYGNYVVIDHENGLSTLYAHLSSISISSSVDATQRIAGFGGTGIRVNAGDVIGVSGNTAGLTVLGAGCGGGDVDTFGYHLHFELRYSDSLGPDGQHPFKAKAPFSYVAGKIDPNTTVFVDPKLHFEDHRREDGRPGITSYDRRVVQLTKDGLGAAVRIGPSTRYAVIDAVSEESDKYYFSGRSAVDRDDVCSGGWMQLRRIDGKEARDDQWFDQPDDNDIIYGWLCAGDESEAWLTKVPTLCSFSDLNHEEVTIDQVDECIASIKSILSIIHSLMDNEE